MDATDPSVDPRHKRAVTKAFLKTLPMWDDWEALRVDMEKTKAVLKRYDARLKEYCDKMKTFPDLDQLRKNLPSDNCDTKPDIAQLNTPCGNESSKTELRKSYTQTDDIIDESMLMLQEKVRVNEKVMAMVKPGKPWVQCSVLSIVRVPNHSVKVSPIIFRLRAIDSSRVIVADKYSVARMLNLSDKLQPPKRVIAGLTQDSMMPGVIGYEPITGNKNRYLVLFDDSSAGYFTPDQVYPIVGQTRYPWLDPRYLRSENYLNEGYIRYHMSMYPRRHLLKIKVGQECNILRGGVNEAAKVIEIDCDVMRLRYPDETEETVHLGSARLNKNINLTCQLTAQNKDVTHFFIKLVLNMHLYHTVGQTAIDENLYQFMENIKRPIIITRPGTARKSTASKPVPPKIHVRIDHYRVDKDDREIELLVEDKKAKAHKCSPDCLNIPGVRTELAVKDITEEFRDVSDLKIPLLLGWKRKFYYVSVWNKNQSKRAEIIYTAPCGKILKKPHEVRRHLNYIDSKMDIDYFSFDRDTDLTNRVEDVQAFYYVQNMAIEAKTGRNLERKNIGLLNTRSEERLARDFQYRNETFPHKMLEARGFSYNHDFKSGCDCEDDCYQRASCPCHRLNEEFYGREKHNRGAVESRCQYAHKRLTEQVATGIFECNAFCACSSKCSNRVVQNGIRFRLQVYKTIQKGWGVITLDDIPKGAFICTYSAELLDDADQYGDSDMYYADLDYVTVNEARKELPEKTDEGIESGDEDVPGDASGDAPGDAPVCGDISSTIQPEAGGKSKMKARGRPRKSKVATPADVSSQSTIDSAQDAQADSQKAPTEDSVSLSSNDGGVDADDNREAPRYPRRNTRRVRYTATREDSPSQSDPRRNVRFKRIHDLLESHDYTLDARMQGNVGRFFNHSCDPNCFVQNVFIDTHDLRFPVVAFFASKTIKASSEITWNYNYKMGSIEGRQIQCFCSAPNCSGRIL